MPCGATQDRRVMVERSDRMWSTGEGNGKPLQYSCLENHMNSMKRQNDRILKEELPSSVGAQYATGDQWRNNFRKNEGMEPKQKQYPAVHVTGDRSKVWCCKEQYCIGTWSIRSINQGKLEVVKRRWQEWTSTFYESVNKKGPEGVNLIQMTIISTAVGKNPIEESYRESQGWGSLVGCHLWGHTELDRLKRLSSSSSSKGCIVVS